MDQTKDKSETMDKNTEEDLSKIFFINVYIDLFTSKLINFR